MKQNFELMFMEYYDWIHSRDKEVKEMIEKREIAEEKIFELV